MADTSETLRWARILAIVGGIVLILSALAFGAMFALIGAVPFFMDGDMGMGGGPEAIFAGLFAAMAFVFLLMGVVLGGVAIYGATRFEGEGGRTWSIVVLVIGILAFFTGGGFGIGSAMVAAGGGMALYAHTQAA